MAAIVLYIATWPLTELECTKPSYSSDLHPPGAFDRLRQRAATSIQQFYVPMHRLSAMNSGRNPFEWYWEWWMDRLDARYPME